MDGVVVLWGWEVVVVLWEWQVRREQESVEVLRAFISGWDPESSESRVERVSESVERGAVCCHDSLHFDFVSWNRQEGSVLVLEYQQLFSEHNRVGGRTVSGRTRSFLGATGGGRSLVFRLRETYLPVVGQVHCTLQWVYLLHRGCSGLPELCRSADHSPWCQTSHTHGQQQVERWRSSRAWLQQQGLWRLQWPCQTCN